MNGFFTVERSQLEKLNPKERQMLMELRSLAIFKEEGYVHKEYQVTVPKNGYIISYRKLAEKLKFPLATTYRVAKQLEQKGLLERRSLGKIQGQDGLQERILFLLVEHRLEHSKEHPVEPPAEHPSSPESLSPHKKTAPNHSERNTDWNANRNADQNSERNKKKEGFKKEGTKKESNKNSRFLF